MARYPGGFDVTIRVHPTRPEDSLVRKALGASPRKAALAKHFIALGCLVAAKIDAAEVASDAEIVGILAHLRKNTGASDDDAPNSGRHKVATDGFKGGFQ